jgi:serine/threonine-protein kinase
LALSKTGIIVIGLIIVLAIAGAYYLSIPHPTTVLNYTNHTYGYSIDYLSNWRLGGTIGNSFVFYVPIGKDNVNILVENATVQPRNLSAYTAFSVNDMLSRGWTVLNSTPATLSGSPAHEIVYTATVNNVNFKLLAIYTIRNNDTYLITYGSEIGNYQTFLPAVQNMIASFQILNST